MNGFERLVLCFALAHTLPASVMAQQNAPAAEPAPAPDKAKAKRKAADPQALPDRKTDADRTNDKKRSDPAASPTPASPGKAPAKGKAADAASPAASASAGPVVSIKPASTAANQPAPPAASSGKAKPPATQQTSSAAKTGPTCAIEDAEQPRGGRLDLMGSGFGQSPLVKIAGKPVRMIERREDRLSVQVPADSNGGAVTLLAQGQNKSCGALVIIGKNR
jgi:cytoskeletal protein RodZ